MVYKLQCSRITIIKPNKPVLVPSKVHKYAPARTTVIKVHILIPVLLFFPKFGRIINISSMWGVCGASCEVHYSASKAAVIGMTKALAKEVGPSGITVNCIAPGLIDTPMNANLSKETINELCEETPVGRIGTPEDIANAALFLASDSSSFITGQVLGVDGGFI